MAKKDKGYIILQRSLLDHWIWMSSDPFDKRSAWVDLLLLANHADTKININGNAIPIKRGQHFTSIAKLCSRWHWSKNKCVRFLSKLVCDGMVSTRGYAHGTLITLVNYDKIQTQGKARGPASGPSNEPTDEPLDGPQTSNDIQRMKNSNEYNSASRRKEKKWQ